MAGAGSRAAWTDHLTTPALPAPAHAVCPSSPPDHTPWTEPWWRAFTPVCNDAASWVIHIRCAVLFQVVLCPAVLCCVLSCAVLYSATPCCVVLCAVHYFYREFCHAHMPPCACFACTRPQAPVQRGRPGLHLQAWLPMCQPPLASDSAWTSMYTPPCRLVISWARVYVGCLRV